MATAFVVKRYPVALPDTYKAATRATVLVMSDILALTVPWVGIAFVSRYTGFLSPPDEYLRLWPLLWVFIVVYGFGRLYSTAAIGTIRQIREIVLATSLIYVIVTLLTVTRDTGRSTLLPLSWILSLTSLISFRVAVAATFAKKDWWSVPAVLVGSPARTAAVIRLIRQERPTGFRIVGVLSTSGLPQEIEGIPVLGGVNQTQVAADAGVKMAIFAPSSDGGFTLAELVRQHGKYFANVVVIPDLAFPATLWVETQGMGHQLLFEIQQQTLIPTKLLCKRLLDLVLGGLVGLLSLPVVLGIAAIIKLTSSGPVFYGQTRVGRKQELFRAWKFRTMIDNADQHLVKCLEKDPMLRTEWERDHKLRRDPRVTSIGRFLRATSLDELPQLWNVLFGEMSLVGPRPIVRSEVQRYGTWFDEYCRVLPGMTGLWQVSGRNNTSYERRVELDAYYIHNWSVWFDLYILFRTVRVVLARDGAY